MYDNWSEIIEIMSPVLGHNRSRYEIKMALGSCLRTLGWRSSKGSMLTDYRMNSGKIVDIVLGYKQENDVFHHVLPIIVGSEAILDDNLDHITRVMVESNVKIAINVGSTFDLCYFDNESKKAISVGQISFEKDNEEGLKFSSLLLARDFNEKELEDHFVSLYNAKIPALKLNGIINSIVANKSKAEDVLRLYLEFEGFEGDIVDKVLENVGIDIYFKNNVNSKPDSELQKSPNQQLNKSGHDNTRFSFNSGPFLSKRHFVLGVVSQYIKDHPSITLEELELRFPSEIASKVRGVIRTYAQVKIWASQSGPDILTRYCTKENEILTLHDGTEVVVNSQWGAKNFPKFLSLAKSLYNITSDAPYEGVDSVTTTTSQNSMTTNSTRAKNFKFSMVGIRIGESIVFDATKTEVKVVSDDTVEYQGVTYRLSTFVRTFLPDNMRTPSDTYRGPDFFSYNGETLTNLRNNKSKEQTAHLDESGSDSKNNGIQISLHSFNSFKTKK